MAKAQQPQKTGVMERVRQIGMVFSFTAKRDRLFVPLTVAAALLPLIATAVLIALGATWIWIFPGIMVALLAVLIVLNLRSNKAMMAEAERQPGSAASIVQGLRGDWRVTPAIASTTQFDMVHLVIGRPGVVLLGEGDPARVRSLLGHERRRLSKVIGSADLHDFIVGSGKDEVPVAKLRSTLMKLPRTLPAKEVNSLDKRLTALTSARPQLPKGAIPKSMRPPRMPRAPRMR